LETSDKRKREWVGDEKLKKGSTTLGSKFLEAPFFCFWGEEKRREEKRRACCCCKECE
jgi:hypothetical protein